MNEFLTQFETLMNGSIYLLLVVIVWTLIWKGIALWKASKKNHLIWFIAILVINTLGILEILYIFLFSKISLKKSGKINVPKRTARKSRRKR